MHAGQKGRPLTAPLLQGGGWESIPGQRAASCARARPSSWDLESWWGWGAETQGSSCSRRSRVAPGCLSGHAWLSLPRAPRGPKQLPQLQLSHPQGRKQRELWQQCSKVSSQWSMPFRKTQHFHLRLVDDYLVVWPFQTVRKRNVWCPAKNRGSVLKKGEMDGCGVVTGCLFSLVFLSPWLCCPLTSQSDLTPLPCPQCSFSQIVPGTETPWESHTPTREHNRS